MSLLWNRDFKDELTGSQTKICEDADLWPLCVPADQSVEGRLGPQPVVLDHTSGFEGLLFVDDDLLGVRRCQTLLMFIYSLLQWLTLTLTLWPQVIGHSNFSSIRATTCVYKGKSLHDNTPELILETTTTRFRVWCNTVFLHHLSHHIQFIHTHTFNPRRTSHSFFILISEFRPVEILDPQQETLNRTVLKTHVRLVLEETLQQQIHI